MIGFGVGVGVCVYKVVEARVRQQCWTGGNMTTSTALLFLAFVAAAVAGTVQTWTLTHISFICTLCICL